MEEDIINKIKDKKVMKLNERKRQMLKNKKKPAKDMDGKVLHRKIRRFQMGEKQHEGRKTTRGTFQAGRCLG